MKKTDYTADLLVVTANKINYLSGKVTFMPFLNVCFSY